MVKIIERKDNGECGRRSGKTPAHSSAEDSFASLSAMASPSSISPMSPMMKVSREYSVSPMR